MSQPVEGEYVIQWESGDPKLLARYEGGKWIIHGNPDTIKRGTPFFCQNIDKELFG